MKKVSSAAMQQSRNISWQRLTIGLDLGDRNRRVARPLNLVDTTRPWVPRSSRLSKGGYHERRQQEILRHTQATRSRNEISPHPTFTCTNPASPNR
jgi:hypothetical protein